MPDPLAANIRFTPCSRIRPGPRSPSCRDDALKGVSRSVVAPGDPAASRLSEKKDDVSARVTWSDRVRVLHRREADADGDRAEPDSLSALLSDPAARQPVAYEQRWSNVRAGEPDAPVTQTVPPGVRRVHEDCRRAPRFSSIRARDRLQPRRASVERACRLRREAGKRSPDAGCSCDDERREDRGNAAQHGANRVTRSTAPGFSTSPGCLPPLRHHRNLFASVEACRVPRSQLSAPSCCWPASSPAV